MSLYQSNNLDLGITSDVFFLRLINFEINVQPAKEECQFTNHASLSPISLSLNPYTSSHQLQDYT